jgi:hypothetical protein
MPTIYHFKYKVNFANRQVCGIAYLSNEFHRSSSD